MIVYGPAFEDSETVNPLLGWEILAPRWLAADLDGDGVDDVVTSNSTGAWVIPSPDFDRLDLAVDGNLGTGFSVGDLDGDGTHDLLVSTDEALERWTYRDTWQPDEAVPMETAVRIAVADMTGDGRLDVVATQGTVNTGIDVLVFVTAEDGSLGRDPSTEHLADEAFSDPQAFDMDGDGTDDILTARYVVYGDAAQAFAVVPLETWAQTALDVDADGDLDAVRIDDRFEISENLDGRSFAPFRDAGPAPDRYPRYAGTINLDGGPHEILTVQLYDGGVHILGGDGNGGIEVQREVALPSSSSASSILVGDFDGDGTSDLYYAWPTQTQ